MDDERKLTCARARVCVCVCVCVRERETERETDRQTGRQTGRQAGRQTVGDRLRILDPTEYTPITKHPNTSGL